MNELQVFNNPDFGEVRTIERDGEPWFVGKDVATALGYGNTKDALSVHIDDEDKEIIQRSENTTFDIPNRGLTIINESGLYSLVLSSKLPTAKAFKRWITSEVIPSIRKHGMYAVGQLTCIEDVLIQSLQEMKEMKYRIANTNKRIDEIRDVVSLDTQSWRSDARRLITQIAQKMGGNEYIRDVQAEIFKLVDQRAGISLATRLTNKRRRMAEEGVCKSKRDKLTKVDIIAEDKKAIEIYVAITKEMAIKYGVGQQAS